MPQLSGPLQNLDYLNDDCFDAFYLAAVQSTDEAILNAMLAAEDSPMHKPVGVCRALDGESLIAVMTT
jgi:D-aminopeptidase